MISLPLCCGTTGAVIASCTPAVSCVLAAHFVTLLPSGRTTSSRIAAPADIGIWNALTSPLLLGVVAVDGELLAYPGTTRKVMLAGRYQYLTLGYEYSIGALMLVMFMVPFTTHLTGVCCRVSLSHTALV